MKKFVLLSLVATVPLLYSCDPEPSSDVNQDRIETQYSMVYKDGKAETVASAQFWFGSTPLKIKSPAQIIAENVSMKKQDILGFTSYTRTFNEKRSQVTFEYTDHDGRTFTNIVPLAKEISLPDLTSISIASDLLITWQGEPVGENETVAIEIIKGDSNLYYVSNDNHESSSILIEANSLSDNFLGEAKIKISRISALDLQQGPEKGGKITSTYQSKTVEVIVEE